MIAESDAKIAYWLTLMPSAPNEQIAGKAGASSAAVRRHRQRMGLPNRSMRADRHNPPIGICMWIEQLAEAGGLLSDFECSASVHVTATRAARDGEAPGVGWTAPRHRVPRSAVTARPQEPSNMETTHSAVDTSKSVFTLPGMHPTPPATAPTGVISAAANFSPGSLNSPR